VNRLIERTIEEIRNPDIYTNMFSEVIGDNPGVRQRKAEDISEEDDGLGLPRGIVGCRGEVVGANQGALGLTGKGETLVAICATHD